MTSAVIDFETRSEVNLKKAGAWVYAEHPSTEVLCLAYKIGDGPVRLWTPELETTPQDLFWHVVGGHQVEAHNAFFERAVWENVMVPRFDWPVVAPTQWRDTMAACAYRSLPLALEKAALALDLPTKKDMAGNRLLQKLSRPRRPSKKNPAKWFEGFEETQQLYDYCVTDVEAEWHLGARLGPLPTAELRTWFLDQKLNTRGVRVDLPAVEIALSIIRKKEIVLTEELVQLTGGAVTSASQVAKLVAWCDVPNLQKDVVESELRHSDITLAQRRALEIRQALGRSSTKKLSRMRDCTSSDGRVRGLLQYHGASTGRWAGRLVQPQNFPRPGYRVRMEDILVGDPELLDVVYGSALEAISYALRGFFVAEPGRLLVWGDYAGIEARVTAWLAGQEDMMAAFEDGADLYCQLASRVFGREITKDDKYERQVGKVAILGLGYQMGAKKYVVQAAGMGAEVSPELAERVVRGYRQDNPHITTLWENIEAAAILAVTHSRRYGEENQAYEVGPRGVVFKMEDQWLTMRLPSGRRLWYFDPEVREVALPWSTEEKPASAPKLSYWTVELGRWRKTHTYGGKLTENAVQAISRDIMVEAMHRLESHGFPLVLTVHDEIVAEVDPEAGIDVAKFKDLMVQRPRWGQEIPISAEMAEPAERYAK